VPIALYLAVAAGVTLVGLGLGRDPQSEQEETVLSGHGAALGAADRSF
jgi:hypothetical protein